MNQKNNLDNKQKEIIKRKIKINIKKDKKICKMKKKNKIKLFFLIKIFLICFLICGIYYSNYSYKNSISLLGVFENSLGEIKSGSIINLELEVKLGSGKTFVNLNTIEDVDTQISIINSQKIACDLFELNCQDYDFYYTFYGPSLFLKGPSASSAIAILVSKTLNFQKIENTTAITGSLNSGGIVGTVGGVRTKILTAKKHNFKKVIIPTFTQDNLTNISNISIVKTFDIVKAYNNFEGEKFVIKNKEIRKESYNKQMKNLADLMCNKTKNLSLQVNYLNILNDSLEFKYLEVAKKSFNSSVIAYNKENYYSSGSFCYNANIYYDLLIQRQKNLSLEEIDLEIKDLKEKLDLKLKQILSFDYKKKIKSRNDFYIYLILNDRLAEACEQVDLALELGNENLSSKIKNKNILNKTNNNLTNNSTKVLNLTIDENVLKNNLKNQKEKLLSFAKQRFYTINLWENFVGKIDVLNKDFSFKKKIVYNDFELNNICSKIISDISIKSELLNQYNFNFLDKQINEQKSFLNLDSNKYLCIYRGLELNGRIDSFLNLVGIDENNKKDFVENILNLSQIRIQTNSDQNFALIPYIYLEYSKDLFEQDDLFSSLLYSNFAISYTDLNLYLENENQKNSFLSFFGKEFFSLNFNSMIFIFSILLIIGFL